MGIFQNFIDGFKPEAPGFGLEPQGPAVADKHTGQVVTDEKASVGSGNGANDYGSPEYANVQHVHMTPDGGAILTSDESGLKRNLTGRHMQSECAMATCKVSLPIRRNSARVVS